MACFIASKLLFKITQIIFDAKKRQYPSPIISPNYSSGLIANRLFTEFLHQCLECLSEFANIPEDLSDQRKQENKHDNPGRR